MSKLVVLDDMEYTIVGGEALDYIAEYALNVPQGHIDYLFFQGDTTGLSGAGSFDIEFLAATYPWASKGANWAYNTSQKLGITDAMVANAGTSFAVGNGAKVFCVVGEVESIPVPLFCPHVYIVATDNTLTGTFTYHVRGLIL
jgi:hypothetical protein